MKGQTKLVTPVYTKPILDKKFLAIRILPFREFIITEFTKTIFPFGGNKEELVTFGKTTAGWLLMRHDDIYYFGEEACPTCLCEISGEPHFKLPCCGNEIHAECWMNQLGSFGRGLWSESHLKCPFCRENYFEGDRTNVSFWINHTPLVEACYKIPGFSWADLENKVRPNHYLYNAVKGLIAEKESDLPEEEHGGWAVKCCDLCKQPEIAGKLSCAEEMDIDLNAEFICGACEWGHKESKDHRCFKHGKQFAMFKCDSCCHVATWDCFSNHYCNRCHDIAGASKFFPCPGKDKCPLGVAHPTNSHGRHGESDLGFVLGCFKCVDPNYEVNDSYQDGAPDPFREADLNNNGMLGMFKYSAPPPVCPPAKKIAESIFEKEEEIAPLFEDVEEEVADPPEENEIYLGFISQFQPSDDESDSNYGEFIAQFQIASETESESNSESESESSEISIDEVEAFPGEVEEHILPVIEPRPMVLNISCDSVLSEETVNLWNFNQGFDLFDNEEASEDVFSSPPSLMNRASSHELAVV